MCSLLEGLEMLLVELQVVDLSFRPLDFGPVGFSRVVAGRGELLPLVHNISCGQTSFKLLCLQSWKGLSSFFV